MAGVPQSCIRRHLSKRKIISTNFTSFYPCKENIVKLIVTFAGLMISLVPAAFVILELLWTDTGAHNEQVESKKWSAYNI